MPYAHDAPRYSTTSSCVVEGKRRGKECLLFFADGLLFFPRGAIIYLLLILFFREM